MENNKAIALVAVIVIVAIVAIALSLPNWSQDEANRFLFARDTCLGKDWLPNIEISPDRRIEYCTDVIKSRSWSDRNKTWVYNGRGILYATNGQYDRAIEDFTHAIMLDPKDALARFNRGQAWSDKGDYENAVTGYTEAIQLDANYEPAYRGRGYVNFYRGNFSAAASDLLQSIDRRPDARPVLWRFLARSRLGLPDIMQLSADATKLKADDWPYPVIEFYLGQRTAEQLRAAATKPVEQCELAFYLGEWYLLRNAKSDAKGELQTTADTCPKLYPEFRAAIAELKQLNP